MPGNNQVSISPDETTLANIRSSSNKPPELYLQPNTPSQASAEAKPVTTSPIPEFFTHDWIDPRIVSFKARDGATVYGRMYALFLCTSLLSMLALLSALDRGGLRRWALWAAAILLCVATHPYGALVLASQGAFVLLARERLR